MKTTQELFRNYNQNLKQNLIPNGNETIIGTLTNPNDEIFNTSLNLIS